jgi:hypothetical protein
MRAKHGFVLNAKAPQVGQCDQVFSADEPHFTTTGLPELEDQGEGDPNGLCVNMECVRVPPDETGQWQKCALCLGYYDDNGLGDVLFNQEAACSLCGKLEDTVQMKSSGQYLCGVACDED